MERNAIKPVAVRQLGKTGEFIPIIGQGTYKYTSGVDPLRYGYNLGAKLIDTAEIYGNENVVGDAFDGIDDVFICTKLWRDNMQHDSVLRSVESSLSLLKRSYIDLYYIHFPSQSGIPLSETVGAIEGLMDEGVIRHFGVSNFSIDEINDTMQSLRNHPLSALQYRYNKASAEIENDILPFSKDNGMTLFAYEPLGRGGALCENAVDSLKWILRHENTIVIPRSGNVDHIRENIEGLSDV